MPDAMSWEAVAAVRLLVAGLCGAAVGFEREISEKGAAPPP